MLTRTLASLTIAGLTLFTGPAWAMSPPHDASNNIGCRDCHSLHPGTSPFSGLKPRYAQQEIMCKTCHNPTGMEEPSLYQLAMHEVDEGTTTIDCGSCHSVHSPSTTTDPHTGGPPAPNLSLIRGGISKYVPQALNPAIFQARPDHFTFATTPATGICQVCHTQTDYYTNDGANTGHSSDPDCTHCHPHGTGFIPDCLYCHNQPQDKAGVGPPGGRRQITGIGGDFAKTTHHVAGSDAAVANDCMVCHWLGNHQAGTIQLRDPDQGVALIYDYDPANAAGVENFCLNCHDGDGATAGNGTQSFSDGQTPPDVTGSVWSASAHKTIGYAQNGGNPLTCMGDGSTNGCHGNAHGSDNIKILNAASGVTLDGFCNNCHTDGKIVNDALSNNRPGGYISADDIEEAFAKSTKHNVSINFTKGANTFTLQCTSCHNPHIVTGKYWDAESGVTPVTRPDFSDPTNNPRAVGTTLWGDEPGEKMDDFAALASGTGGFYYKIAQGYSLGDTGLPFDKPAKYQPPKSGSGYEFEFAGDILPDYTTLCQDCHSSDMGGGTQGSINWGVQHGFASSNMSSYVSDSGTAGFWGNSGNPDVLFDMNYVTRGRHNGHFMRWPYDSADRGAGINFVLACTDCHEAHGSNRGGMIRERYNVNDNGACGSGSNPGDSCADGGNWNNFCNSCHYYYGGQHAGMSCGNASCHLTNSPHRIDKGGGGGGTQLMLTATGYEGDYVRPDFTPEIENVTGNVGSDQLNVTFRESQYGGGTAGIWANPDLSGALAADDFWLLDKNGDNPRTITNLTHTAGALTATITMSAPLQVADMFVDTLAVKPASLWGWYEGGYNNFATGVLPAEAVSAGPWPVAITTDFAITRAEGAWNSNMVYVEFTGAAYANTDGTGDLQVADFAYTNNNGPTESITAVDHTAGNSYAVLTFDVNLVSGFNSDQLAAAADAIYDANGLTMPETAVTITYAGEPRILAVEGVEGHDKLSVWFSGRVYANNDATGVLEFTDFALIDAGGLGITGVEHTAGRPEATLTLDGSIQAGDIGNLKLTAADGSSIYDINGNPVLIAPVSEITQVPLSAGLASVISVEGVAGSDKLKVTFESQVFANDDETGDLQVSDFTFTDGNSGGADSIVGVSHSAGSNVAIITVNTVLVAGDIGVSGDTLAAVAGSIFGPSSGNFPLGTGAVEITAQTAPALATVKGAATFDKLLVTFSEGVYGSGGSGELVAADFTLDDDNLRTITGVQHVPGQANAVLTLSSVLVADDFTRPDTLAAAADAIYNNADNPAGTAPADLTDNGCPAWGTTFPIENVPQYALWGGSPPDGTVLDETGLISGTVANPTFSFPNADNDVFTGAEVEGTGLETPSDQCLNTARALTIEARVKPTRVDNGTTNEFNRIFERRRTLLVTILNTDYRGDDIPQYVDKASIEVKYRVENAYEPGKRHTCPHPQWPGDTYVGNDALMHQISSDIDQYPLINNHWYRIRVVFNSDKSEVAGSDGTPVDIFIDDQGTDGLNNPNPTPGDPTLNPDYEQWPGYVNASKKINESSSCKWGSLPGDYINLRTDTSHIGSNWNNSSQQFDGQIDWVTWEPVADYTGVDDPPN